MACLRGLMTCIYGTTAQCFLSVASTDTPFSLLCCAVCCLIVGEVSVWVCSPWKWLLFALCKLCHFVMNMPFSSVFSDAVIHMDCFCHSLLLESSRLRSIDCKRDPNSAFCHIQPSCRKLWKLYVYMCVCV